MNCPYVMFYALLRLISERFVDSPFSGKSEG